MFRSILIFTPLVLAALAFVANELNGTRDPAALEHKTVQSLRDEGYAGLDAFLLSHSGELAAGDKRVMERLDQICAQKNCYSSKLYWYTDLEAAKAKARAEHKPILSLHLLGRLDEELSCANSRFFRKTLYSDRRISAFLREHYILHWKTVLPVPKVTIDFGDGRVLKQTITGNSLHYVLDSDGRPLDAIPGLLGPTTFLATVSKAEALSKELESLPAPERSTALIKWHQKSIEETLDAWEEDLRALKVSSVSSRIAPSTPWALGLRADGLEIASSKLWAAIAARHPSDEISAPETQMPVGRTVDARIASRLATSKMVLETPLFRQLETLRRSVTQETVRNEYLLHRQIHHWFSDPELAGLTDLALFDARVYRSLFLMPLDDPWYGLRPPAIYAAIDDGSQYAAVATYEPGKSR